MQMLGSYRKMAEHELLEYRESLAYIKGYEASKREGTDGRRYLRRVEWTGAIEDAWEMIEANDSEKAKFFTQYYGLESPRRGKLKYAIVKLSMEYCVSITTLYRWREQVLDLVIVMAARRGLM